MDINKEMITLDGNEAVATVAHRLSEVIAIYPITPSSPMGEHADKWSANGRDNLWGTVPQVIEMQSEAGAAGAVHGALQRGALTTTFTASQGLLLMIPNMFKIAGEMTPAVFHVAARSVAGHALSIFCDHGDVMACRSTGWAMLASNSVQEAQDFALIAQAATLDARIPMLHFFDGFRTSHEVAKIEPLTDEEIRHMIRDDAVRDHRHRGMSPDRPVIRGTAQNPDVFFQSREAVTPFVRRMPAIVAREMERFARITGRRYELFEYVGDPDAERVIVMMGSGAEAAHETIDHLRAHGESVGLLKVRLFRPMSPAHLIDALPASARSIAVLDRCKEPGAAGEPLYKDVVAAIAEHVGNDGSKFASLPRITGGRYGLSSKEFTPGMVAAVLEELTREEPKKRFTIGIRDDVSMTSLEWDPTLQTDADAASRHALFYGLGSDGTVSANRNTIKIIGEGTDLYAQAHFVFDSKKSGAVTVSHLRFGPQPIRSTYLIGDDQAEFVGCHQSMFVHRFDMLRKAAPGAIFLLNASWSPEMVWERLPRDMQRQIIDKQIKVYVIDAYRVAQQAGLGRRINTVMQTCYFALSDLLSKNEAIERIKASVSATYRAKGGSILEANFRVIDASLEHLHEVEIGSGVTSAGELRPPVPADAPEFVRHVTGEMIAGRGDDVPVSRMPVDGTWPVGTAKYEKRELALEVPVLEEDLCIMCGKCVFVCPHSVIRSKVFDPGQLGDAPESFRTLPVKGKEYDPGLVVTYQASPQDCTGCALCVDICPARDKSNLSRKALNMHPVGPVLETEMRNWDYFERKPEYDRELIRWNTIKGSSLAQPLFEFSGACEGCGETPYIRLATQLFGDRMLIANATGCSSIYGGNLPTTPYTADANGRGPAWNNSLFEDNAEFGLGIRIALEEQRRHAHNLLRELREDIGADRVDPILDAEQGDEASIHEQRRRVAELEPILEQLKCEPARNLLSVSDALTRKSVWIIGGDGWAYDIGFGGLDHVLASGRDVNVLVLDTEVYSNTGGQMSKATPRGAVAKFAAGGKPVGKKDLAMIAMAYEHVYVAHVALGAKDVQTLRAFREAESYDGPSLIIAYSPCIAHGVDLKRSLVQQQLAVASGHWPLFRYDPRRHEQGQNPLQLDSKKPSIPFRKFAETELRFGILTRSAPDTADTLLERAQREVDERFAHYQQLASMDYSS
ncbi:MAG: pyruvate:ferredoxin (flavodoxin) oxidoreductase [Gammaproteobacteria bacterium]